MAQKPSEERIMIRREYDMAEIRLRKIFNVPDDEMIINFEYDQTYSRLRLTTLKDKEKREFREEGVGGGKER